MLGYIYLGAKEPVPAVRCARPRAAGRSGQFFYLDPPIFHLADISFKADRTRGRNLQRRLQQFAVAGAVRNTVLHRDLNFVPVLGAVFFQGLVFVGAGDEVVAALELGLADEDTAVGAGRRAKLEAQHKVLGEFLCRP